MMTRLTKSYFTISCTFRGEMPTVSIKQKQENCTSNEQSCHIGACCAGAKFMSANIKKPE
jgi:hypothetical protein